MKKYIILIWIFFVAAGTKAQNDEVSMTDSDRLTLSVWLPDQEETMPSGATSMLYNKLLKAATSNGISAVPNQSRFIFTANSIVLEKSVTPSTPALVVLDLELTFYIGDGFDGKMYESYSLQLKGAGKSENKAYLAAIKKINANSSEIASFIDKAKSKVVSYFDNRCDFVIEQAKSLEAQEQYAEAITMLTGVPEVCKECYEKSMKTAEPIYQKHIDYEGQKKFAEAKALWAANQNMAAANAISVLLGEISPNAACYKDVEKLYGQVSKRISEVDGRDWNFKLKEHQLEVDKVAAMRDVGVAYGEGQPKTMNYNTSGWWTPQGNKNNTMSN